MAEHISNARDWIDRALNVTVLLLLLLLLWLR